MTANGWAQIGFFLLTILVITKPVGVFMARVFGGEKTVLDFVLRPIERIIYRLTGIDERHEMRWTEYATAMLLFSGVSMVLLYLIERVQRWMPLNPQKFANIDPGLAFGTAASFTTNTNWQAYSGESTMSYLTQMAGLAYHNFASAAVGIAVAIAVIRGIARKETDKLGNFWVDTTRGLLWVLLPVCLVGSLFFVSQGVLQNLKPYTTAELIEPQTAQVTGADGKTTTQVVTQQVIAQGPVASQEVIKEFGTNGGGFFGANSAHPFENPTPLANFFEMVLIFAIPAGLTYTLGRMTNSPRHGWAIWAAMAFLFLAGVTTAYWAEAKGNPLLSPADQHASVSCNPAATWKEKKPASASLTPPSSPPSRPMRVAAPSMPARLVHAAGRNGSADQYHAWRSSIRRRRRRSLRHYRFRDSRRVHCWPDGRQNARISGQENRILRREDGHARGPHSDLHDSWVSRRSPW